MLALEGLLAVQAGARPAFRRKNTTRSSKNLVGAAAWIILAGLLLVAGFKVPAQDTAPTEYQIKAAFLYNFAKFVEWPPQVFATPGAPIVIGVLGNNVFGDNLEKTLNNKVLNNRPLQYKQFDTVAAATNCQILFISPSEKARLPKIIESLRDTRILTVSETPEFISAGGMINFVLEANKIRFQINDEAAKKAGLKISSKLLSLAAHS